MPRYTVTDPGSGRTLTLEGDSPPTEQELEQIFSTVGTGTSRPTAGLESVAAEQGRIAGQALDLLNVGLETGRQQRQREAEQNLPPLPPEPISRTPPGVSTIAGGPQLRIAGAPGTGANLGQQIAEAAAEPLLQLPRLAPSMEQFRKLTRDPFTPEEEVATADLLKQPAALPEQAVVGAMSGVDELIRGVAGFLSSPSGIAQVSAMKTPLAPAVALKWAKDMVEGGMISAGEALDAYRRGDMEAFARHVTFGTGMILGAGGIVKHGVGTAESAAAGFAPRGQGIASPELKTFAPVTAQAVSETIKPSEVTSAETIRTYPGHVPTEGKVAEGGKATGGYDVERAAPQQPQPVEPGKEVVTPQTESAAQVTLPSTSSWWREEMLRRGMDPNRTFNDVDLSNPSIREAISLDPTLTTQQKNQLLETGSLKSASEITSPEIQRADEVPPPQPPRAANAPPEGQATRAKILDRFSKGEIEPAVGEPSNVVASWEMIDSLQVPEGWKVEKSQTSKYGSAYWTITDRLGETWKVSVRSHEPSPVREKEFGVVDDWTTVRDPHDPESFSEGMTRLEGKLAAHDSRLEQLHAENAKRWEESQKAEQASRESVAREKHSVANLEQEVKLREEMLVQNKRANGKPINTEFQRKEAEFGLERARKNLVIARAKAPPPVAPEAPAPPRPEAGRAVPGEGKQPWEMTRQEVVSSAESNLEKAKKFPDEAVRAVLVKKAEQELQSAKDWKQITEKRTASEIVKGGNTKDVTRSVVVADIPKQHRASVERALKEGKPVPPEVLADYPELAKPALKEPVATPKQKEFVARPGQKVTVPSGSTVLMDFTSKPAPTPAAGEGGGKAKLPTPEQAPLAYPDRKFSRERSIDRDEFVKKNIPQDQWQNTDTVGPPGEILWETKRGIDTWGKSFENPISSAVFTTKDGRVVALDPKNPELIRVLDPKDPRITWNKALVEKYGIELKPTPAAPAELPGGGKEAPISQGPGAASPGDVPKKSQIEQLGSAFKGGSTQRQTLREKVKEIFDLKNQKEITKDLLARTLSSLKTAGDYLINTWKGQTDLDPILKSKGLLSAELEMRGWRMRQAAKDMKRAVPDRRVREAISKYVDAGGDMAKLQEAAGTVPEGRRAPYERAMNLTPEEKIFAGHIRSFFESRLQEAIDAGVLRQGIEDYIHRIYPRETAWKKGTINAVQNGVLDTRKPGLAMQRVFELDSEAERAGYYPVNDFIPRILDYEASLSKVIASRAAVKRFTEIDMPDGRKMLETSGLGIPIENPEGIREATLIRPGGRPANLDLTGYQSRDYPALKKWKWASTDAEGKPIFVEGNVLIHPDAVHRIDALLEPSKIRKYAAGRGALNVGSVFKQTMLDFSGFHQVQIAIHGLEHKVNPFNLVKEINFEDPNIQGLLKGGMTLGGEHVSGIYQEGLVGRSLSRQIPVLGELMRTYHEWLFQDFIPRVKTTMALHALERNRSRFAKDLASGKITEDVLYHQTAKEANAAFGELNYIMLERSKTVQDLARLTLLAPDFLEARGRFVLQAGTRLGGEQRMALFLGALTLYTVARVMNKTLDDQWHFEPENAFSIIHNGKAYSIRTVQGDVLHALEEPVRFWLHRLNPTITRPLFQLMAGRDEFGRKRDFWQTLGDTISNLIPISMRSSREQKLWTSLLNAFGGSVRRYSEVQHVYQKAREWNQQHGVRQEPGEFIYDASKDTYRPLKLAIMDGDIQAAAVEYRKLIDSKAVTSEQARKHFSDYGSKPFTGSSAREGPFKASLSDDEKRAYEGAKQERQRIVRGFYKAVAESSAPPVNK